MPRLVAMSVLRDRCKRRADLEGDDHISDAEWNALISEKVGEAYSLVNDSGCRYFETTFTITASGAASYAEPADHFESVSLDYVASDGKRREVRRLHPSERNAVAGQTGEAYVYEHVDDLLRLYPVPSSGTYELRYIPQPPDLSAYADGDLVDLMTPAGEAFIVWGTSILAKSKSESDVTLAMQREAAALERLQLWAARAAVGDGRRPTSELRMDDFPALDEGSRWPR